YTLRPDRAADAAGWAGLGLLDRRGYLIARRSVPGVRVLGRLQSARPMVRPLVPGRPGLHHVGAREALDVRRVGLTESLTQAGVWAHRLDDPDLVQLMTVEMVGHVDRGSVVAFLVAHTAELSPVPAAEAAKRC